MNLQKSIEVVTQFIKGVLIKNEDDILLGISNQQVLSHFENIIASSKGAVWVPCETEHFNKGVSSHKTAYRFTTSKKIISGVDLLDFVAENEYAYKKLEYLNEVPTTVYSKEQIINFLQWGDRVGVIGLVYTPEEIAHEYGLALEEDTILEKSLRDVPDEPKEKSFTKSEVIDLLRQQRELCYKHARSVFDSSILNAPSPLK